MKNTDIIINLIKKVASGDTLAFGKLYDLYFDKVYHIAGYFVKTGEIREEIVSDVFISIWFTRERLTEINNIEAYIYTITKNTAYNYLDKFSRIPEFTNNLPIEFPEQSYNPEEIVLNEEIEMAVKASIEELPEKCKLVFLLSREEGLRYQDIARILSISEKTVNAHIVTALKKLHSALKKYLALF